MKQLTLEGEQIGMNKGASFSTDGRYRYDLWRIWNPDGAIVTFVGLNPSTADHSRDDPTIRRCVQFASDWGFGGMHMANLFAFVSSDPRALCWPNPDPVGPENDAHLKSLGWNQMVVICWGSWGKLKTGTIESRTTAVLRLLSNPYCLGHNQDGTPKHPLYLPKMTRPVVHDLANPLE